MNSTKNLVLTGFLISLISVAFNSLVISYVNKRLKQVDDEFYDLGDSLTKQSANLNEGDSRSVPRHAQPGIHGSAGQSKRGAAGCRKLAEKIPDHVLRRCE